MIERPAEGIVIVGTAHVSKRSVQDVEETIRAERPTKVLVELDQARFEALRDPDKWKNTDIIQILRDKKQHLFLLQLYLASMQAQVGRQTGSAPGAEMMRAIEVAEEVGAEVVLIDRDISITLKRGFSAMNLWQRMRLFWNVWMQLLTPADDKDGLDVDAMLEQDAITAMTEEFARFAPVVKTALIDERDAYMADHIRDLAHDAAIEAQLAGATGAAAAGPPASAVVVVGAGHVPGMMRVLADDVAVDRRDLETLPNRFLTLGKAVAYLLPAFVIGAFVYLGMTGDFTELKANLQYWILVNGALSALGALLARGHILSVLVAFVAAPLTSLSPALAAGWFAGATEAKVHTPKVADFEAIKQIESMKDFWRNDVVRVLLVTAFANLGSVVGTWLGAGRLIGALGGT